MKRTDARRKGTSVKLKIIGGFILFTVIAIVVLWLFQVVFFERIYKSFKISELEENGNALAAYIDDKEALSAKAAEISKKYNFCIAYMDPEVGKPVRLTDVSYLDCVLYDLRSGECMGLYNYAVENGGSQLMSVYRDRIRGFVGQEYSLYSSDESTHSVILTLVLTESDGSDCVLFINSVISPVGATVKTITLILIVVSVLLAALALVLALFISKSIARPIVDVNVKAKEFAKGNYTVRFEGGSYREITELSDTLNYAGEELSKVDRLRKELISNISHDLRTPLTLIKGYGEVMRDLPGECSPENIQTIIDETDRLSSIVSEMLDYSKLESGNYSPSFEILDLSAELESVVRRYRTLNASGGYRIEYLCEGETTVRADRSMIIRALLNLVNNAITHTGEDKLVRVRLFTENGMACVEVSDTGEGIPEDQLELIWERYYKADAVHKRASAGTGLGLSIVRSIMAMHSGRCSVRSEVGSGSTFRIELPLAKQDDSTEVHGDTEAPGNQI